MKNFLTPMAILCLSFGSVVAKDYDIRKVRWGMTVNEVVASETWGYEESRLDGDKYRIQYFGKLLGKPTTLNYVFDGNADNGLLLIWATRN